MGDKMTAQIFKVVGQNLGLVQLKTLKTKATFDSSIIFYSS